MVKLLALTLVTSLTLISCTLPGGDSSSEEATETRETTVDMEVPATPEATGMVVPAAIDAVVPAATPDATVDMAAPVAPDMAIPTN